MAQYRKEKIADQLHMFLAQEVRGLNDPRLQLVTLTEVKIAADLKSARVFWSALPGSFSMGTADAGDAFLDDAEIKATTQALNKAGGLLKRRIGEELKLRHVPDLIFVFDRTVESGSRIDALLDSLSSGGGAK
ncbi:MAG: 30S ribosome-binding factor RbfA [Bdellovibrionales bacterium]|nr:30S ribosome-binding factor RbfA [Bdellovibrionales bacterium]